MLDRKGICRKIRELTALNGLSQAELARRAGLQPSQLNVYLQGRGDLHSRKLVRILLELGLDIETLLEQRISQRRSAERKLVASSDLTEILEHLRDMPRAESEAISLVVQRMAQESRRRRAVSRRGLS